MKWIAVKNKLPTHNGVVRVKTLALCYSKTLFHNGYFNYDLECAEICSSVGMGISDKVTHFSYLIRKSKNCRLWKKHNMK